MIFGLILGANFSLFPGITSLSSAFVLLLQMTALPYIALSLMVGIGSLTPNKAKSAVKASITILLLLTVISILFILLTTIAFPDWKNASFYSAATVKTEAEFDLVSLFIPANPFNAFANAIIPSVVLFSIFFGVGLINIKGKRHTLAVLTSLQNALGNISGIVMRFAPVGVFCIGYKAAATIDPSLIEGLVVYIFSASILVILLAFVVFPILVATLTPFRYRQVLKACRSAMITAFATGSFFAVLPVIIEKLKVSFAELPKQSNDNEKLADILVPISYSLPAGGKLLALLFALFGAWFSGAYIGPQEYAKLIFIGIPQLFGSTVVAMPTLLDLFNVSSSMFELYLVADNLIASRIGALLSVSFTVCFVMLIASVLGKTLRLKMPYIIRNLLVLPFVSISLFMLLQFGLTKLDMQYQGYDKFIERQRLFDSVATKHLSAPEPQNAELFPEMGVLQRIKRRGFIRVGYFIDDLPYAFHNKQGELVGFDIEIINMLAADLVIGIEYVRIRHSQAEDMLRSGYLDMTTGFPLIPENIKKYTMTAPYTEQPLAFLVKNERRDEFTKWQEITKQSNLIIGIPETYHYEDDVKRRFSNITAWEISTPRLFFKDQYQHIDAMLIGAAAASGWSLINPYYSVVVPKPKQNDLFMSFAINHNDHKFERFMRNWIKMKEQSGRIDQLFNYWIKGKQPNFLRSEVNDQIPH